MALAKVDHLGRLSLPIDVRRHLNVSSGDSVQFVVDTRGEVRVRAGGSGLAALRGILRHSARRAARAGRTSTVSSKEARS